MAPLVAASPAGVAIAATTVRAASRLKREVEQVIQAYLSGSSELSRAELGPAALCYLIMRGRRARSGGESVEGVNSNGFWTKVLYTHHLAG